MPQTKHPDPWTAAGNSESLAFPSGLVAQPCSPQEAPPSKFIKGVVPDGELTQISEIVTDPPPEEIFSPEELADFSPEEIEKMREHPAQSFTLCSLLEVLAVAERPEDLWLWCLHCNQFFQVKDLQVDFFGSQEQCPICGAAGLDVDIYLWNTYANDHPDWPARMEDLRFGQRSPA